MTNEVVDRSLATLLTFVDSFDEAQMTPEEARDVAAARQAVMDLGKAWTERVRFEALLRGKP